MDSKTEKKSIDQKNPGSCDFTSDKPTLALDALAKLTRQFASKPDFKSLMEVFILTLSGQFSVPNAFIILRNPERGSEQKVFIGSGKYRKDDSLHSLRDSRDFYRFFQENRRPYRVEDLMAVAHDIYFPGLLLEAGVRLVAPLSNDRELIGIIALGEKANRVPFDDSELELFSTMLLTIAPMIANSFLFMELTHLNIWYLEILDNVKMGVFVFDSEHQLKKINITGLEIMDKFVPELIEKSSLTGMPIQTVFPDSVFHSWIRRFITADMQDHNRLIENMVARKKDRESIFNVRVSKIVYDSNYKFDLVVTLDDITAQKISERRLFELEKLAEQGQMASSISHELNNYLALVLGGVELTQLALGRGDLDRAGNTLEKLKSNIDKMKRFTSGLMDYSRLNTSKKTADLNELVRDVLSFVVVQTKFKPVALHTELAPDLPPFEMDKDQIAQLLLNFLNNAMDAIEEAGIETGQIWIKTSFENNLVAISVADNGVGIKPDVKERLFKAHLTTKEKGHGYGLVTCGKIIQNHGGQVEIESELSAGSMFTVYFPVDTDKEAFNK